MPHNARRQPREEVTLRVDYMDAEGRSGLGLARNLSYTGIALTSLSRPLQVGDRLVLTFVPSTGKACKLHTRVVHTLGASAGLVFTDAQEAYRQLLGAIVAAFADRPAEAQRWRTSHRSLRVRG
jgi:PilZ domain